NLSARARFQAIRSLHMPFNEKKTISEMQFLNTDLSLSSFTFLKVLHDISGLISPLFQSFRRFRASLASARQHLIIWQGTLKEIGCRFGTSVLSYFLFLTWLLKFNLFSLIINFCFITIPQIVHAPNISSITGFRGLELLTGVGYFNQTVLFYGGYNGEVIVSKPAYNMQLAYFFTVAAYLVLCGVSLIYSMSRSFQKNFVLETGPVSGGAWRLLCSWDFSVVNESLSERLQEKNKMSLSDRIKHLSLHLLAWLLFLGLALGSGAGIYFLGTDPELVSSFTASTLLLPVVVSLINLIVPLLYSLISKIESYSNPRAKIYISIVRCDHCFVTVTRIITDYTWHRINRFTFISLFQNCYSVIGTMCIQSLGVPEFDIARNVLDLIYAQTLDWNLLLPLLPVMQVLKLFIIFYMKKISLSMNCQPPKHTGRAAQIQTVFIALLFFPSFVGALSMVAFTVLKPSDQCGPFQGLDTPFHIVFSWTDSLPENHWVGWIFENILRSELFYYLISLIVLVITYFLWQITQGRKQLIKTLREGIVNEGNDKAFLLNKLQNERRREMASFRPQVLVLMCSVCSASSLHLVVISKILYSTERVECNCGDFSPTNTRIRAPT
uniref:Transmembrane channel-like protein n=1 Tax=Sinocyclocheilus grahami TaxID=75366 RepID=A0A672RZG1_SINGR